MNGWKPKWWYLSILQINKKMKNGILRQWGETNLKGEPKENNKLLLRKWLVTIVYESIWKIFCQKKVQVCPGIHILNLNQIWKRQRPKIDNFEFDFNNWKMEMKLTVLMDKFWQIWICPGEMRINLLINFLFYSLNKRPSIFIIVFPLFCFCSDTFCWE